MKKCLLRSAVLAALATIPSAAFAQEITQQEATQNMTPDPVVAPTPNTGALHFGLDLNVASSYFFRGYNQEDRGFIFQPNVYGFTDFVDSDDFGLRGKVGLWNSIHSKQTASEDAWYEADLYCVVTATFRKTYYASVGYTYYIYPGDAFEAIQEIGVSGGMTDLSTYWDKSEDKVFTIPLEVGLYKEIDDGNGEEDFYAELKVTPTLATTYDMIPGFGKAAISFPFILGTSFDTYYTDSDGNNEFFGYIQGGVAVSLPMTFVDPKYGTWSLNAGVNYIHMLADSVELANDGGTEYEVQGIIGVSMTY